MDELEAILTEASGLDAFLADAELIERYFSACQNYYGSEWFPRKDFDALLTQLRETCRIVPSIRKRLWETEGLGEPLAVESTEKTYGRDLDPAAWKLFLKERREMVLRGLDGHFPDIDFLVLHDRALSGLTALTREVEEAIVGITDGKKKTRVERMARVYKSFAARPEIQAIGCALLWTYLADKRKEFIFKSEDADIVIGELRELHENPRKVLFNLGINDEFPVILGVIKSRIPSLRRLLARKDIFPELTVSSRAGRPQAIGAAAAATRYEIRPIPRRFHGIFKGLSVHECVGGFHDARVGLLPARWATVALSASELLYVEIPSHASRYKGFIHIVPIVSADGTTYGNVEFQSPILRKRIRLHEASSTRAYTRPFFSKWLFEFLKTSRKGWRGLVLGQDPVIDPSACAQVVRGSINYSLGRDVGDARDFRIADPLAEPLARIYPSEKRTVYCRSNHEMFIDATMREAGRLRVLACDTLPD